MANYILLSIFFVLGAILASFIGVISERVYTGQSWTKGRSRCNSCRRELAVRDLVPVLSWVASRGRCRTCGSRVPGLYVLYELTLGALFALAYVKFGLTLQLALFLPALAVLFFVVVYDLRHTIVPITASSLLIVFGLLFALSTAQIWMDFIYVGITALGIAFFFFCLYYFSKGRAMGLGDTPVALGLSLLAGHAAIPGFLFSFWIGGVIGILILVFRKGGPTMGIEVPFVPFMAAGFLLALFTQWTPFLF